MFELIGGRIESKYSFLLLLPLVLNICLSISGTCFYLFPFFILIGIDFFLCSFIVNIAGKLSFVKGMVKNTAKYFAQFPAPINFLQEKEGIKNLSQKRSNIKISLLFLMNQLSVLISDVPTNLPHKNSYSGNIAPYTNHS